MVGVHPTIPLEVSQKTPLKKILGPKVGKQNSGVNCLTSGEVTPQKKHLQAGLTNQNTHKD